MVPPIRAIGTSKKESNGMLLFIIRNPVIPAIEFTNMNKAETAAASFILPHAKRIIIGLKIIPPPIPIKPENKPIPNPKNKANGIFSSLFLSLSPPSKPIILIIATKRNTPKICLYKVALIVI